MKQANGCITTSALALLIALPAIAQTEQVQPFQPQADGASLGDIVVTARTRSEAPQWYG